MIFNMTKPAVMAGAVLVVAGCVSVLPEPETPDALYRIEAVTSPHTLAADLIIQEPDAPQIIAGQAFVSEDASGAIRLVRSVEWSERSTRLIQLALVDSFSTEGAGTAVLPGSNISAPYALQVRLQMFGFHDRDAVCKASVGVLDISGRALLDQSEVAVRRAVDSSSSKARAAIMKTAAEQCVDDISQFAAGVIGAAASN